MYEEFDFTMEGNIYRKSTAVAQLIPANSRRRKGRFCVVRATSTEFGLHVGNKEFNSQTEE